MVIGSTIGHYRIVEKLGEGGMGVVYKAEDTQLRRNVALKFLSREALDNEEVAARLIREAQAAASLDHPNICHVHGIHQDGGETFIAMAFIDGLSLAAKIKERPLPLEEALDIATQIAEGLNEAHEHGVVHRDVKPQNILLTAKGQAKILDFGLAALVGRSKLTKTGTTLGTPAYMAPEQLEGKEVDQRADLWALGCVLYEMLTQKSPFDADYEQAIGYGILNEDPEPATALRSGLPTEIDRVIAKALTKDPALRYQHADDLLADLRVLQKSSGERKAITPMGGDARPVGHTPKGLIVAPRKSYRMLQVLAATTTTALLALAYLHFTETRPDTPVRRFSLAAGGLDDRGPSISPDGRHVVYRARTETGFSLWLRPLASESAQEIAGTDGASSLGVGWSPDSRAIVFGVESVGELRRISIDGGDPITLAGLPQQTGPRYFGASWSPDGEHIVFSSGFRLWEVSARGGEPEVLLESSDALTIFASPQFLPSSQGPPAFVYTVSGGTSSLRMWVLNLETGEREELGPGSSPVYSKEGYLIHGPSDAGDPGLWARPFALDSLKQRADSLPISAAGTAASLSDDGTLVYLDSGSSADLGTLVWRSRTGELLEEVGQPQPDIGQPALSPDEQRVAVRSSESGNADIWVHDLTRSTKTRLTFGEEVDALPTWSPSGSEIAYRSGGDTNSIMRRPADGTGEAMVLVDGNESFVNVPHWSPDGRYLVYIENDGSQANIRYVELGAGGEPGEPVTLLGSPATEAAPQLSPDARFLAYQSNESGRFETYLTSFPSGRGKWLASVDGGIHPRWRADGRELYYLDDNRLMAVSVSTASGVVMGTPQLLFEAPGLSLTVRGSRGGWDNSADGRRFLTVAPVGAGSDGEIPVQPVIRIVQNWHEEFRDREQ